MRPFLTLHDPKQAGLYYEDGRWTQDTFYSLLDGLAQTQPGALALRDGRVSLSWSQLKGKVDSLAALYRSHGLVPGDRVSIWMSNKAESVIAFLACSREGLACNPSLHRTYTCQEIVELLERLSTRILITEQGWGADRDACDFDAMLGELPSLKAMYTTETLPLDGDPENVPPQRRPGYGELPRLHIRNHRNAEMRHAFSEHTVVEWSGNCRVLGLRQ